MPRCLHRSMTQVNSGAKSAPLVRYRDATAATIISADRRLSAWSLGDVLTPPAAERIGFGSGAGLDPHDFAIAGAPRLSIALAAPEGASKLDLCLGVELSRDWSPATALVASLALITSHRS